MAKSINLVVLSGRLGRDAETRFAPSGTAITTFSIATDRRVKNGDQWENATDWHNVVAFKQEWASNYLVKGADVSVTGRLQTRKYDKDGETRYMTEVVASEVVPHGKSSGASAAAAPQPQGGFEPMHDEDGVPF